MTPLLTGDNAIAVPGMRVKSMPEEVLSLPLMIDPSYPVVDGSVIYLTADKKGCTTVQNVGAGYAGIVVLYGPVDSYKKGDVVPVMVKGKIWSPSVVAITDLTTVVGANATGQITETTTAVEGMRFGGTSVGSQNLTVIEILGA